MSTLAEIGVFITVLIGSMIATYAIGWVGSGNEHDEFATAWGIAVVLLAAVVTVLLEKIGLI